MQRVQECQRDFRTLTCRAFPFYPYLDNQGAFLGLATYPEFRFGCWILSNLEVVSQEYKLAFRWAFQQVFERYPDYRLNFIEYSQAERENAAEDGNKVLLLDFAGDAYQVDPRTEKKYPVQYKDLRAFGPFEVTRDLKFPDE